MEVPADVEGEIGGRRPVETGPKACDTLPRSRNEPWSLYRRHVDALTWER